MSVIFTEDHIETWNQFIKFDKKIAPNKRNSKDWICRGMVNNWPLTSSLERVCFFSNISLKKASRNDTENKLVREFRRRYHFYGSHAPRNNDYLEWLAIMQHHGAPTRLLDFSYSVFVAAYFALEETSEKGHVVWCIDNKWLLKHGWKFLGKNPHKKRSVDPYVDNRDPKAFRNLFFEYPSSFVMPVNPFYYNERLTVQQGLFLCPGDISISFEENMEVLNDFPNTQQHVYKIHLHDTNQFREKALRQLNRMNINRATLFPGLDGFAKHLSMRLPELSSIKLDSPYK